MRQENPKALEKTPEINQPLGPEKSPSLNWFGSKESIGMFTAKIRSGLRTTPRATHGLETRTISQIVDAKEAAERQSGRIVKLPALPDSLKRQELISA